MALREEMVKRAVGFLRHPKVKGAPQEKQIAFLKDKKLTAQVLYRNSAIIIQACDYYFVALHLVPS